MADAQISQSGPIFSKISLLDKKSFDFAGHSDFDNEAAVLYSAQDAGVRNSWGGGCKASICTGGFGETGSAAWAKLISDIIVKDYTTKKILKSYIYLKSLLFHI